MRKLISGGNGALKNYNYIREDCHYDFICFKNTFSGVMMSDLKRLVEKEDSFVKNAVEVYKQLSYDEPFVVIKSYQKDYPKTNILNGRVCMTGLIKSNNNGDFYFGVIWFDDGTKEILDSLDEIFDQIDWSNAREYDY